jgi:hypothetical protein
MAVDDLVHVGGDVAEVAAVDADVQVDRRPDVQVGYRGRDAAPPQTDEAAEQNRRRPFAFLPAARRRQGREARLLDPPIIDRLVDPGQRDVEQRLERLDARQRVLDADEVLVAVLAVDPEDLFIELDARIEGRDDVLRFCSAALANPRCTTTWRDVKCR